MGPWNFYQYMHPFEGSLEFTAVGSDAMKPKLLRNFCEFHQHKMKFHHYMSISCVHCAKVKFPSTYDGISITTCLHHGQLDVEKDIELR